MPPLRRRGAANGWPWLCGGCPRTDAPAPAARGRALREESTSDLEKIELRGGYFARAPDKYEQWYRTWPGRLYDELEGGALERQLSGAVKGGRLLDVGAGTGHWSRFFARLGFSVTALDISETMLGAAARMARVAGEENAPAAPGQAGDGTGVAAPPAGGRRGAAGDEARGRAGAAGGRRMSAAPGQAGPGPRMKFVAGDAAALPFLDGSFDAAAAVTVLEFVEEPQAVLAEMARVVRPGGRLVVGALNRFSPLSIKRVLCGSRLAGRARAVTVWELRELLDPLGAARVRACCFVPPLLKSLRLARAADFAGRLFSLPTGDFLAAAVRLPGGE